MKNNESKHESCQCAACKKLKPCPFCGGKAEGLFDDEGIFTSFEVVCTQCGVSVSLNSELGYWKTESDAHQAWNNRIPCWSDQKFRRKKSKQ